MDILSIFHPAVLTDSKNETPAPARFKRRMYRQGDILFVSIPRLPEGLTPAVDLVVARGETTGHSHRLEGEDVELLVGPGRWQSGMDVAQEFFIRAGLDVQVVHEEHAPIALPEGLYCVVRQREYDERADRLIRD